MIRVHSTQQGKVGSLEIVEHGANRSDSLSAGLLRLVDALIEHLSSSKLRSS